MMKMVEKRQRGIASGIAALMLTLTNFLMPFSTYALTNEQYYIFSNNGINVYEPGNGCSFGSVYAAGPIAISGSNIEEKIWSGLTGFLTTEQAAGVMGNMYYESGLNPAMHEQSLKNRYQPGFDLGGNSNVSYGLGLIQWSFGRRVRLYEYVRSENSSLLEYLNDYNTYARDYSYNGEKFLELAGDLVTDELISLEIQFLKDELDNNSVYGGIFTTASVFDAAKYFLERIEVPQNPQIENHMNRVEKAEEFYEKYSGYKGSKCASTDVGQLIEYVKRYAWPTYHNPQFLERMPDYADAVASRSNRGLWVGGSVGGVPGIDCGGFVTTIMNESGFDPDYNFGGDVGRGASAIDAGQLVYIRTHQDVWQMVNDDVNTPISSESVLNPGDIGFSRCSGSFDNLSCGHTYLYIGEVEGFEAHIVSASYSTLGNGRAPMATNEPITESGVVWFHKVK